MPVKFMPALFYQQNCKNTGYFYVVLFENNYFFIMASTSFRLSSFPLYAEENLTTSELAISMERSPIFRS